DPVAHGCSSRCLPDTRVIGEAEIVVRAKQKDAPAVQEHARPLGAGNQSHPPVDAELRKLVQPVLDVAHGPCSRPSRPSRPARPCSQAPTTPYADTAEGWTSFA